MKIEELITLQQFLTKYCESLLKREEELPLIEFINRLDAINKFDRANKVLSDLEVLISKSSS